MASQAVSFFFKKNSPVLLTLIAQKCETSLRYPFPCALFTSRTLCRRSLSFIHISHLATEGEIPGTESVLKGK